MQLNHRTPVQIQKNERLLSSVQNRNSRYVSGGETEVRTGYLEWWERTNFEYSPDTDALYAVERKTAGNLRIISAMFYNTDIYWWIIAQYNSILDPYGDVVEGLVLRIPSKDTVNQITQGKLGGVTSKREVSPNRISPIV